MTADSSSSSGCSSSARRSFSWGVSSRAVGRRERANKGHMARRDLILDEEKKSYAGVWLLSAILLVVGALWAILDDSFFRRPWKAYQTDFFRVEEQRERSNLTAEQDKLNADDKYQALQKQLGEARASAASGETAKQLATAQQKLQAAAMKEKDADIKVRFIKSELEEAWYVYDQAIENGGNVEAARKRRDQLSDEKTQLETAWHGTQ